MIEFDLEKYLNALIQWKNNAIATISMLKFGLCDANI